MCRYTLSEHICGYYGVSDTTDVSDYIASNDCLTRTTKDLVSELLSINRLTRSVHSSLKLLSPWTAVI